MQITRARISIFSQKQKYCLRETSSNNEGGQLATKILECITTDDSKLTSWLNVTAISGGLDVHEMELLAKLHGLSIKPTTSRLWTALGDKEVFSEEVARHCRWYIVKEGDQGYRFADKESQEADEKLLGFIKSHYKEIDRFEALDGSQLKALLHRVALGITACLLRYCSRLNCWKQSSRRKS